MRDQYDSDNACLEREQGISYAAYLGYSEAQLSDYQKLIDRIYPEIVCEMIQIL